MRKCIDCGKVLTDDDGLRRCNACSKIWQKRQQRIAYEREAKKKAEREKKSAVWIDGHPQVCRHLKSCRYGSKDGCSYILASGRSRIFSGLFIKDGKCDAYIRGKYRASNSINSIGIAGAGGKNYIEV